MTTSQWSANVRCFDASVWHPKQIVSITFVTIEDIREKRWLIMHSATSSFSLSLLSFDFHSYKI